MTEDIQTTKTGGWKTWLLDRLSELRQREGQIFMILALVIGALTGLAVVAFIVLTERLGMRLYPVGGAPWRRVLFPVAGSLTIGYLLYKYYSRAMAASPCARCWVSSSAPRQLSPAEFPSAARALRCRSAQA
jgi:CIC family chloride channel protein